MLPLQVLGTRCSLRPACPLRPHGAVLCSVSPPPSSLLWAPVSKWAPPPVTLSVLPPPSPYCTLACLWQAHCLSPPLECRRHEGQRAETLSALNPGLPAVLGRWLGKVCLVREVHGVTFVMLLYCGLLQFLKHLTPSAPGFLSIRLSRFCCRQVGPGSAGLHRPPLLCIPYAPVILDDFHKAPCPFRYPCLCTC